MSDDIIPLDLRLGLLHAVRASIGVFVFLFVLASPTSFAVPASTVAGLTAAFLLLTSIIEIARLRLRARGWTATTGNLLLDGVYLTLAVMWTGEVTSPLLPASYVTLVAVTMLLSYRTGLKIALWFALLFCAADAASAAGWLATLDTTATPLSRVAATVGTFLLFAMTTALFSSFNERALRLSRRQLRALADLGLALEPEIHQLDICQVLASRTVSGFGFGRVAVLALDEDDATGVVQSAGPAATVHVPRALVRSGAAGEALEGGQPLRRDVRDEEGDPFLDALLPLADRVVLMPMRAEGQTVGLLIGEWPHDGGLPRWVYDALTQIALHGAFALRTARLLHDLDRLAQRDPLTGLGNRRSFSDVLEREMARARRDGSDLSLALFDVDHFKSVNDVHGHQTGDQVLRAVARVLAGGVRGADLASRYGGEEFVVVLPGAASDSAGGTAERLRLAVEGANGPVPVTVSAGVATFPVHAATGAQLVALADRALYEAKRRGRNRVVTASEIRDSGTPVDDAEQDLDAQSGPEPACEPDQEPERDRNPSADAERGRPDVTAARPGHAVPQAPVG